MYIYIHMYICVYIQIYSYADTSWDDDRNSCKSTCSSCIMQFHMHSLMTDYCDVNFSSRSYRYLWLRARSSVQMDISCRSWFFGNMRLVVFEMYRSCSAWALFRRVITDSLFFSLAVCLSRIEMGLSTFIKFLPHSKRLI